MASGVTVLGKVAAVGFMVCLQAISACSPRPAVVTPVPPTTRQPDPPAIVERDPCALIPAAAEPITTVGLTDRVDPTHAPRPANDSERLVFRQLYETLVTVDCLGRVRPALAASWSLDTDGRSWIVTLRENARFTDGTPVTADDIRAAWSGGGNHLNTVDSFVSIDDRRFAITFRRHNTDVETVKVLAHANLAIAKPATDSAWPLGTRSARVTPPENPQPRTAVITITREPLPPLRFLVASGDARDPLDGDADLLLTRDPATLDYARTRTQFQAIALPWQRTHVLLTPDRARPSGPLAAQARQVLADDAVRGEARGAVEPFWWQAARDCELPSPPTRGRTSPAPRIVYTTTDAAARDLAERFVGQRNYERALGLAGNALAQALRLGADAGYVVSVDGRPLDPCRELQALVGIAPWLDPDTIVPLIDTRLQAVVRRGRSGATAEWDGGLVLTGVSEVKPR